MRIIPCEWNRMFCRPFCRHAHYSTVSFFFASRWRQFSIYLQKKALCELLKLVFNYFQHIKTFILCCIYELCKPFVKRNVVCGCMVNLFYSVHCKTCKFTKQTCKCKRRKELMVSKYILYFCVLFLIPYFYNVWRRDEVFCGPFWSLRYT